MVVVPLCFILVTSCAEFRMSWHLGRRLPCNESVVPRCAGVLLHLAWPGVRGCSSSPRCSSCGPTPSILCRPSPLYWQALSSLDAVVVWSSSLSMEGVACCLESECCATKVSFSVQRPGEWGIVVHLCPLQQSSLFGGCAMKVWRPMCWEFFLRTDATSTVAVLVVGFIRVILIGRLKAFEIKDATKYQYVCTVSHVC